MNGNPGRLLQRICIQKYFPFSDKIQFLIKKRKTKKNYRAANLTLTLSDSIYSRSKNSARYQIMGLKFLVF